MRGLWADKMDIVWVVLARLLPCGRSRHVSSACAHMGNGAPRHTRILGLASKVEAMEKEAEMLDRNASGKRAS